MCGLYIHLIIHILHNVLLMVIGTRGMDETALESYIYRERERRGDRIELQETTTLTESMGLLLLVVVFSTAAFYHLH